MSKEQSNKSIKPELKKENRRASDKRKEHLHGLNSVKQSLDSAEKNLNDQLKMWGIE